jgi:diguanylate cyclase (GGDEF)-like protein
MKHSVLIVDDCPSFHKLMRAYVADEPIEVHSAFNGADAIELAERIRPRLILLDVDMAATDGFEVCRRLKKNPLTRDMTVVFLSADVSPDKQMQGMYLGAEDYLTKRCKPQELCERIRTALRIKPLLDETPLIDGPTQLWNRSFLQLQLPQQLSWSRRVNKPLACIIAEIDQLASICWNFGERIANQVIRATARILASQGRAEDVVFYLQHGKFAMLLPGIDQNGAFQFADRARAWIYSELKTVEGVCVNVACSFGIADTKQGVDSTLLQRGEAALSQAKLLGNISVIAA